MIGIMIDQKLEKLEKNIKYTCDFIFETLGIPYRYVDALDYPRETEIILLYSLIPPPKDEILELSAYGTVIYIQAEQDLLNLSKVSKEFIENNTQEIRLFNSFPVISSRNFDNPIEIHKSSDSLWGEINFDIIANIFYHLSGYDEKLGGSLDNFGRYTDCCLSFISYVRMPYVNYLLWITENFIKDIVAENPSLLMVKKEFWPAGEDFAFTVSHNVDRLQKWDFGRIMGSIFTDIYTVFQLKFPLLFKNIKEKFKYIVTNSEVYWRFEDVQEILNRYSLKATWFVAALEEGDEPGEIDYLFDDPDLQEELRRIVEKDGEVALLTDINSEKNKEVETHKKSLGNVITGRIKGVRNVAGKYLNETSPEYYDKNDFLYDSSKMLIDQVGFRNGIAVPYRAYLSDQGKEAKHWEVPLIFSDHYLQTTKYKFVSKDKAKDIVKTLIKSVQETNGLMSFNFSLSGFNDISYLPQLIDYTLKLLKDRKTYTGTISEIVDWWEQRKQVIVSQDKDYITIVSNRNIKQLTLSIWGSRKVKKIVGAGNIVRNNMITLKDIRKNTEIVIHLMSEEQLSYDTGKE